MRANPTNLVSFALVAALLVPFTGSCGDGTDNGDQPGEHRWVSTVVEAATGAGYHAIAIGSDGHPRIAFVDVRTSTLRFALFDGASWSIETVPGTAGADEGAALILDPSDNPHVGWQSDNGIRYAYHDGSAWTVEAIENTVVGARSPSLCIAYAQGGYPAISFYGGDNFGLKYASRSGGSWTVVTADADPYAGFHGTSLLFDSSDRPAISYYEYSSSALRLVRLLETWSMEVLDDSGAVGRYSSMAQDGSEQLHIAYLDDDNGAVRYLVAPSTVSTGEQIGGSYLAPSLGLAADGTPLVAFPGAGGGLQFGRRSGDSWIVETAAERMVESVSMVVGPDDVVHISAYLDANLVHIRSR